MDCVRRSLILIALPLLLFCLHSAEARNNSQRIQDPYETPYFVFPTSKRFNPEIKYPPYQRCIVPDPVYRRVVVEKGEKSVYPRSTYLNKWRSYWSVVWSRRYFEDEDMTTYWHYERRNADSVGNKLIVYEDFVVIFFTTLWITLLCIANLILYPIISMILFQTFLTIWLAISHRFVRRIFRWFVLRSAKFERGHILRVYEDAGRHPPCFRYNLPKLVRLNDKDVIPKEMDETDKEFWSSDDEAQTSGVTNQEEAERVKRSKATPEFVPEYPKTVEKDPPISDETFAYFVKVKKHGMFAVWTQGISDIDLHDISVADSSMQRKRS